MSEADPSVWDWIEWGDDHLVHLAFEEMADELSAYKEVGAGLDPKCPTSQESAFIARRDAVLAEATSLDSIGSMADRDAMDLRRWREPVSAILYAATQLTSHLSVGDLSATETPINQSVIEKFVSSLQRIVSAYKMSDAHLPPGDFLHAGTAAMQRNKDHMGADLAIVVGTKVQGLPRFRVVLLQAKLEDKKQRGRVDVGQNKGKQLETLLDTGMGYYIFYPRGLEADTPGEGTRLPPMVRSAESVFADVAANKAPSAKYMVSCYEDRRGEIDAIDFSQFVSLSMPSDSLEIGRLFGTAEAAAASLLVDGKPLVPLIVAFDRTGFLSVARFLDVVRKQKFATTNVPRFPTEGDVSRVQVPEKPSSPPKP